jgi:hypothetical protein
VRNETDEPEVRAMKPGRICKRSGKRAYGSHEEAARKGVAIFESQPVREFRAYECPHCKCWHLTTQPFGVQNKPNHGLYQFAVQA